jgi:hypothetical protein
VIQESNLYRSSYSERDALESLCKQEMEAPDASREEVSLLRISCTIILDGADTPIETVQVLLVPSAPKVTRSHLLAIPEEQCTATRIWNQVEPMSRFVRGNASNDQLKKNEVRDCGLRMNFGPLGPLKRARTTSIADALIVYTICCRIRTRNGEAGPGFVRNLKRVIFRSRGIRH